MCIPAVKIFVVFGIAILQGFLKPVKGAPYQVTVKVADEFGAGTDADVYVVLYGSTAQCERGLDSGDNDFEQGSERTYAVDCGRDLGWVANIRIGHRNGMWIRGDDWKVDWVRVQDPYRQRTDAYSCYCWLRGEAAHQDLRIPLHGGWSGWTAWGSCSVSCGSGTQTRGRTCNNPPPTNGGNACVGASTETQNCKDRECPVDGGWGSWTEWGECSVTCGPGTSTRQRQCNNPPPAHGGQNCQGPDTDTKNCNVQPCPVDGGWGNWTEWSPCSVSCGQGVTSRSRVCDSPPPSNGGRNCSGLDRETMECNDGPCPINGGWSGWSQWRCDAKPCGVGVGWRNRSCTNPPPQHGGAPCQGPSYELINCTLPCLARDDTKQAQPKLLQGRESEGARWSPWTQCTVSCGRGTQQRHLRCGSLARLLRGGCAGGRPAYQTRICDKGLCV